MRSSEPTFDAPGRRRAVAWLPPQKDGRVDRAMHDLMDLGTWIESLEAFA
jgi:hypothetical protein